MIFLFIFSDLSFHLLITIDYTGYKPKKTLMKMWMNKQPKVREQQTPAYKNLEFKNHLG